MSFWPTLDHWSVKIPQATPHPRLDQLAVTGYVVLRDADFEVPVAQYEALEYMDWKSGGDTNFAPIASADGELDCRGFWDKGKTDKDALWTSNAGRVPSVRAYVDGVGANFGRVRVIKLEPQSREEAIRSIHRDDNNRFNPESEGWVVRSWLELTDNPDSYMLLMDNGPDGLPDATTETRLPLHKGARFVVDTQRLWHVVVHLGTAPRYALITSFESGPALGSWIDAAGGGGHGLRTTVQKAVGAVPSSPRPVAGLDIEQRRGVAFLRSLGRAGVLEAPGHGPCVP